MALLDRLKKHLDDGALAAAWADATLTPGHPSHPHLAGCAACRARLAELSAWLEDVRADATDEADEAFPAERLAAQQTQVLRRIEAAGRPAKVIAFPRLAAPIAASASPVRRWVASAAAAGLIAGLALGNYMDVRHTLLRPASTLTPETVITLQSATDEDLLWMEEVPASSMPEALAPFDTLTPRARDLPR